MTDQWNDTFKEGRRAGQEDVCREILRYDPSFAHQIAREYLAGYASSEDEETPCPVCGNEERGQGGYLSCECPAPRAATVSARGEP